MRLLATEIRLRHTRKANPTMVMIDGQTVKGGRAGPTFHEAGGRGGYTRGAKRSILIEILGLPLAVQVDSAKPHDVQAARAFLAPPRSRSCSVRWRPKPLLTPVMSHVRCAIASSDLPCGGLSGRARRGPTT
jgi:hypothetical protein